jgi:glycosyltransferase involved in cell wall biosynthesis
VNIILPNGFEPNYTLGFVKGLAANGVELLVVSCDTTEPRLRAAGIPQVNLRGSSSETRPPWEKVRNVLTYYVRTLLLLLRERNGTVHFTGLLDNRRIFLDLLFLHIPAALTAKRYVYTVHNVLPHGCTGSRFFQAIYRFVYSLPDVLLVHTRGSRAQLLEQFEVPERKLRLSSIGLNEEMALTKLTRSEARTRLGFGEAEKLILYFGKIDEYKGLDLLIEAFNELPLRDSRLVVAGSFGEGAAFRERILRAIATSPRRADIHFNEGFIPNEQGEVFFKACDVLCLPYRNIYQSGLIFLGARFGIPIIATDVGSLRDFVEGELGIVTRTNDVRGICQALQEFFAAPDLFRRAEITAKGQKYRWAEICRELVPLYSDESASDAICASCPPAAWQH